MKHYIITRFNLSRQFSSQPLNKELHIVPRLWLDEEYLDSRFELFEKYTFPSIINQTCQDFVWLVLFHRDTPEKYCNRIEKLKVAFENFRPLYLDDTECATVFAYLQRYITEDSAGEEYITSRIDNDDIFHRDYISQVQSDVNTQLAIIGKEKFVVTYINGMQYDIRKQYLLRFDYDRNHFTSMYVPANDSGVILEYDHNEVKNFFNESHFISRITDHPMWVEILTGINYHNSANWRVYYSFVPYLQTGEYSFTLPWKCFIGYVFYRIKMAAIAWHKSRRW